MFIDIHSHLDYEPLFSEIGSVVKNASSSGLKIVVTAGIHPESNRAALKLAAGYDIVKATLGLYPVDALQNELEENGQAGTYSVDVDKEIAFIRENREKIVAIGEIGLDFKTGKDKDEQIKLFRQMLDLALELDKPVVIHSRKAESDALDILDDYKGLRVILHCFSGKKKLVIKARDKGYFLTVPTNVVRSQQFQDMIRMVPLRQLFCETDSPYLSPFREKRNEPAFVVESYKKIAEIKGMDISEAANIIYNNWQRVF